MDSQLFFFINMGVAAFFLIWFWLGRKNSGNAPTQLRLRNQETPIRPQSSSSAPGTGSAFSAKKSPLSSPNLTSDEVAVQKAKNLNILFLYNGHDWDAYQVLGLPAGASLPLVTERYQQLIKQADQGQLSFYDAAYQAILKKF